MEARDLDRIEKERLSFHERVYAGYLAAAAEEPERIRVIDASKSIEEVRGEIRADLDELFEQARACGDDKTQDGGVNHA